MKTCLPPLTSREREIMLAIASGLRSKEIAARFGTKTETVQCQRMVLFAKLSEHFGVPSINMADVIRIALAARMSTPVLTEEQTARIHAIAMLPIQQRVLSFAADGHSDREIASQLGISIRAVESHCHRLRAKIRHVLGIRRPGIAHLVSIALVAGYTELQLMPPDRYQQKP